jgi:hypothetical protein
LGVVIPPRPLLSRPVPAHSARSCDIRATWRGLPTSQLWALLGSVARRSRGRPERADRSRCRGPVPELLRQGAAALAAARAQPGRCDRGTSRGGKGLDARYRSSYGHAVACPGTIPESAPAGTATALGALQRPELRLPCPCPSCWLHTLAPCRSPCERSRLSGRAVILRTAPPGPSRS